MKTLLIRYTVPVEVDVPDDFPVTTADVGRIGEWQANDWCDGRYPHAVEDMHYAALRLAQHAVERAIDDHYTTRIERQFGRAHYLSMSFETRDALAKRCTAKLGYFRVTEGGQVEVAAMYHPLERLYAYDSHVVVCRDDAKDDGTPGAYKLATRTVFEGREAAEFYTKTVAASREPIVVPVSLAELRVGEDRGRLDYWRKP